MVLTDDIATIYRCRWEIELLFRELKTLYELDEFDTNNLAVVKILLYAAVLTLLVSRELLDLVIEYADDEVVFPPERWPATSRSHAQQILKPSNWRVAAWQAHRNATDRLIDWQFTIDDARIKLRQHYPVELEEDSQYHS